MITTEERQVWVGCLACYNDGRLNGEWRSPDTGPEWKCGNPTHEEIWCFDHEGLFLEGECSPFEAAERAEVLDRAEEEGLPVEAFVSWCDNVGAEVEDSSIADCQEAYCGEVELEEYASELAEQSFLSESRLSNDLSIQQLARYFDLAAFVHDLQCEGYWEETINERTFTFMPT